MSPTLEVNENVRPTPVVLVIWICTVCGVPWARVVVVAVGNPDSTVTPELSNVTSPLIVWLNSLPEVVRPEKMTISHRPATGLATDRLAFAVGVVDPMPWGVVVGGAAA